MWPIAVTTKGGSSDEMWVWLTVDAKLCWKRQSFLLLVTHNLKSWGVSMSPASCWANKIRRKSWCQLNPLKNYFSPRISFRQCKTAKKTWYLHEKEVARGPPTTDGVWQGFVSQENKVWMKRFWRQTDLNVHFVMENSDASFLLSRLRHCWKLHPLLVFIFEK